MSSGGILYLFTSHMGEQTASQAFFFSFYNSCCFMSYPIMSYSIMSYSIMPYSIMSYVLFNHISARYCSLSALRLLMSPLRPTIAKKTISVIFDNHQAPRLASVVLVPRRCLALDASGEMYYDTCSFNELQSLASGLCTAKRLHFNTCSFFMLIQWADSIPIELQPFEWSLYCVTFGSELPWIVSMI